jgi:hypothetical protein
MPESDNATAGTRAGTSVGGASGAGVLLLPSRLSYEQIMSVLGRFKGQMKRGQPKDQKRVWR